MNNFDIELKRLDYLYENLPSALSAIFVVVMIILYMYQGLVPQHNLNLWVGLNIFLIFVRSINLFSYKKNTITSQNIYAYYKTFFFLSFLNALLLGSSAFVILPDDHEYMLIIVIFLLGLLAGATITFASHAEIFLIYLFFSFTPYLYIFYSLNTAVSFTFALSTLLYLIVLSVLSKKVSTIVYNNILYSINNKDILLALEQKVQEATIANQAKSEFLSVMSHEIRTPLNAIVGFVQILQNKETDAKKIKYLNTIEKSSKILTGIINDILDLSKIESGKFTLENIEFNAHTEFESLYMLYKENAVEKGIELKNSISKELPQYLKSDILRIKQILSNLLSNAIKFTSTGKSAELIITFNPKNSTLYCEVKDEGIGISQENITRITQAFTQADTSTARRYGGTGLGLSIVTKLLSLLNAQLKIESEIDKGSSFSFELPVSVSSKSTIDENENSDLQIDFKNKKVLVAEDNKTNQMLIKILLEDMNLDVTMANDGLEVEKIFQNGKFDILLMDINMPNKNGIDAMKDIKEFEKNLTTTTPIIALTANALSGDKEKYFEAGFDGYLTKPIETEKLTNLFNSYFRDETIA